MYGQFGVAAIGKEVLVKLVAGSADNLHRTIAVEAALHGIYGVERGRTTYVACTVVVVYHIKRALLDAVLQALALGEVLLQLPA